MKIKGMNTAQVVSTELSMGVNTSFVPRMVAVRSGSPLSQCCVILSMTMMELSTIIPTPSTMPDREMMLMEMPAMYMNSIETISAMGIVMVISRGDRKSCIKKKMMKQARKIPANRFWVRLSIE